MKKLWPLLLALCLLLTGCAAPGGDDNQDPPQDPPVQFTLYTPDANAENFLTAPVSIPKLEAQAVIDLLIARNALHKDITVLSAQMSGAQLNIDFNGAFLTQLRGCGTAGERMMIGSVVNSLLSAYSAKTVYITVNGATMETGHAIYDRPLSAVEDLPQDTTVFFTLYTADANLVKFLTQDTSVPKLEAQAITDRLIEAGVLYLGTRANSAVLEGTRLNLDFNGTFLDRLKSYGTSGERMMIGCVVNTFLSAYSAQTVYITVDGGIMESGHAIYDMELTKMEDLPEDTSVTFTLYTPDENLIGFLTAEVTIPALSAQDVADRLIEANVLHGDIVVKSAKVAGTQLHLDFNSSFLTQLRGYGSSGERMMMGCVANTFLSAYGVETVYITADGAIMESGHAIYDMAMGKME